MNFDPNPLFYEMVSIFKANYTKDNKVVICNEGSSRSAKTWDFFHFLVMYCDHNRGAKNEFYFLRNTLVDCRDFTYKEFEKCLTKIGVWDSNLGKESPKPYYNLFGNHIYFRGLDDAKEAPPSDGIFCNEALEIENKAKLKGWRMRCRKFIVYDWNPKFTQHWCFDMEGQPNTFFTHSTYAQNKHLEKSVIQEIESYEPTHPEDRHLPREQRRPHPENVKNGTADDFQWNVYGLGIRSAPEGLIFSNVRYIDEWPEDIEPIRGLDFGFTVDPSALVDVGENKTDIFLKLLMYEPTENASLIDGYAEKIDIDKKVPCQADSSDKYTGENKGTVEMVKDLKKKGWNIKKVSKTKSNMYWLGEMKKKRINIVNNELVHFARKEQENYRLKMINGIAINQPIDKFNHFWDASKYGVIALRSPDIAPSPKYF